MEADNMKNDIICNCNFKIDKLYRMFMITHVSLMIQPRYVRVCK